MTRKVVHGNPNTVFFLQPQYFWRELLKVVSPRRNHFLANGLQSSRILTVKLLPLKQSQTWKWMRREHAVKGMGCREQEHCHRIKSEDAGPPLTHQSIGRLLPDSDWARFLRTGLSAWWWQPSDGQSICFISGGHVSGETTQPV